MILFFVLTWCVINEVEKIIMYQTLQTVCDQISKHLEVRQKYSAVHGIINYLVGVWSVVKQCVIYYVQCVLLLTYTSLHTTWSSMTFVCRWRWSIWCTVLCWFHICGCFSKEYSVDNECYTIHIWNQVNSVERLPTLTRERIRLVLTASPSGFHLLLVQLILCWIASVVIKCKQT